MIFIYDPMTICEISFSRLHATCNLADYVLGIGAQGRFVASEASTLEPGIPRDGETAVGGVGGKEHGQVTW